MAPVTNIRYDTTDFKSKHTQNTFNPKKEAAKGDFQIKPKSCVDKKIKHAG